MKVYENEQDRNDQPGRLEGGNCSKTAGADSGDHGSKRAIRIAQGGSGGVDGLTTGKNSTYGMERECGGNKPAEKTLEKHASNRERMGSEYVDALNGRGGAKHTKVPKSNLVAGHDPDSVGNDDNGGREPSSQPKAERVSGGIDRWH